MPRLDVSDILLDPDFTQTGLVCTRTSRTLVKGRAVDGVVDAMTFAGVVTPDDGRIFERGPDSTGTDDSILIFTPFRLQVGDASTGADADVVTTPDGQYIVKKIQNFAHFGAGFVVAKCEKVGA